MVIKSDCLVAVFAIAKLATSQSNFNFIVCNCQSILASLIDVRVAFCRRSANSVAHALARAANAFSGLHVWGFSPPDCIVNFLSTDLMN